MGRYRAILLWTWFLLPLTGRAQTTFATITGTVTDPNGAVIPKARIEATHLATNYRYAAESNEVGQYTLAQLRDGVYVMRASAPGFAEFVAQDVTLAARDLRRIDITLTVAAVQTAIEVSAGATLIETETARISDTKSIQVLRGIPLTVRRSWDAFLTIPNVHKSATSWVIRFAGSRSNQSEASFDGISIANATGNTGIGPIMDYLENVQEIRVDMANNTAEYGAVGQMAFVTKAGTNEVHGSAFDYYATPLFRARNPFALERKTGVAHKMGGSLGGPVYLPKIYNGRNRTFFFVTLERDQGSSTQQLLNPTVPLAAWRSGDFSALASGAVVKDPLGRGVPFAGNRIPASRLNPVAVKLQERFYPLPNFGDTTVLVSQNYREMKVREYQPETYNTLRLDHRFSDKAFVFGRMNADRFWHTPYEGNLPTIGQRRQFRYVRSANSSFTYNLRPTLINEFRWGVASDRIDRDMPVKGLAQVRELGLIGLADNLPDVGGMHKVSFSGIGLTGISQADTAKPANYHLRHELQDLASWFRGRHSLKGGFVLSRVSLLQNSQPSSLFGDVTFSNRFTGHPYADFLLGIPTTARRDFPAVPLDRNRWAQAFFITDEFRMNSKITWNLGLRYERQTNWAAKGDILSVFDIETGKIVVPNGALGKVSPLMPRGYVDVVEAKQAGYAGRTLTRPDNNNFAPRIGVAWRPLGSHTVFRSGYGLFYDTVPAMPAIGGPPFVISEPAYTNPADSPTVIWPRVFPATGTGGPSTVSLPAGIRPDIRIPFSMQYNVTIEHERWDTGFRLSYIGTNTRQGVWNYNINQPLPDTRLYTEKPRRFPKYPNIGYRTNGAGHQYHGLTANVQRRGKGGLHYQVSYTWGRDIGDLEDGESPENAYDRRRERAVWIDPPTQRLSSNFIYQLPIGKGKRLWSDAGRLANALAGGWEISGIYYLATGQFLTPQWSGPDTTGTAYTASSTRPLVTRRPDHLRDANLPASQRTVNRWFDPSAFAPPQPGAFGTSAKGVIKGPGENVLHAGVAKYFRIGEKTRIRWELAATNALNHPNWANPGLNISNPTQVAVISDVASPDSTVNSAFQRDMRMHLRIEW